MNSPFALLSLIIAIPFFGLLFALTAKDEENDEIGSRNAFNVCVFSILANILLIWRIFMVIDEKKQTVQLFEHFSWLQNVFQCSVEFFFSHYLSVYTCKILKYPTYIILCKDFFANFYVMFYKLLLLILHCIKSNLVHFLTF